MKFYVRGFGSSFQKAISEAKHDSGMLRDSGRLYTATSLTIIIIIIVIIITQYLVYKFIWHIKTYFCFQHLDC